MSVYAHKLQTRADGECRMRPSPLYRGIGLCRHRDEFGAIRSLSFVIASYAKIGYAITIERLRAKQQQLVERFHGMEEARGSNPLSSTFEFGGVSW